MNRFFAYGCSFTKYYYPTWADIIISDTKEGYNCGRLGSGNQLIANRIWETNAVKKFNSDDTIIIMWSNFFREDTYKNGWETKGNIFFYKDNISIDDLPYYVYRDCNLISSTIIALKQTGANVISTSINNPYKDELLLENTKIKEILNRYKEWVYPQTKTITEFCNYPGIEKDKTRPHYLLEGKWIIEDHPLPLEHCNYVENVLQYNVSEDTKSKVEEWHLKLHEPESVTYDRIFETETQPRWIL